MFAVIRDRSRCLTVHPGEELWVDRLAVEPGSTVTFDQVSLVKQEDGTVTVGAPTVPGASVTAEVLGEAKDDKIYVATFRRRKDSRRRIGHRQAYTRIRIQEIHS